MRCALFEGKDVQGNEIITVHFQDLMLDCLQEFANFVGMITLPLYVSWTQVKIRSQCSAMWRAQKQCSFAEAQVSTQGQDKKFASSSRGSWFSSLESSIDLGRGSDQRRYLSRKIEQTVDVELIKVPFYVSVGLSACGTWHGLSVLSRVDRNRWSTSWTHVVMVDST